MVSGTTSVKGASAGPGALLTLLTKGGCDCWPAHALWLSPALPQVTEQHILTPGPVFASVVSPLALSLGPASRASESWAWPLWFRGPLCPL